MNKHKLAVILYEPDIPQNTGNIIRLCANSGVELHLIQPLGWGSMDDTRLKRAGLDYHEYASLVIHDSWMVCKRYFSERPIIAIETSGTVHFDEISYPKNAVFLFGSETRGLPTDILQDNVINYVARLPMYPHQRSLNLSNSVAIVIYEAWRQLKFVGAV